MWNYIVTIAISILIVYILHQLWEYMKDSYSTKRTKDLIGIQTEKYKKIIDDLSHRIHSTEESDKDLVLESNEDPDLEAFMNKISNETI